MAVGRKRHGSAQGDGPSPGDGDGPSPGDGDGASRDHLSCPVAVVCRLSRCRVMILQLMERPSLSARTSSGHATRNAHARRQRMCPLSRVCVSRPGPVNHLQTESLPCVGPRSRCYVSTESLLVSFDYHRRLPPPLVSVYSHTTAVVCRFTAYYFAGQSCVCVFRYRVSIHCLLLCRSELCLCYPLSCVDSLLTTSSCLVLSFFPFPPSRRKT